MLSSVEFAKPINTALDHGCITMSLTMESIISSDKLCKSQHKTIKYIGQVGHFNEDKWYLC